MSTIAVTGSTGFIGKNLVLRLKEVGHVVLTVPHDADDKALHASLAQADAVVHLAGVNRPKEDAEFASGNIGVTKRLVDALAIRPVPVFYASSIQAALNNSYGQSKRTAEKLLTMFGEDAGVSVQIVRLPNVFGKWCRPNYNSVVATFCHNVAKNIPIVINNPDVVLDLVYIDDVCAAILGWIGSEFNRESLSIEPVYRVSVGELANRILQFHEGRQSLLVCDVGLGLSRALHSTYLSYIHPSNFSYFLVAHRDERGAFSEVVRTAASGQFSFFTAHPGVTRGGHYHHSKTEKFLVVKGNARFGFRHVLTDETFSLDASDRTPQVVETVPGWTHDITNIGEDEMIVLLWANELFDPQQPDTIMMKVSH